MIIVNDNVIFLVVVIVVDIIMKTKRMVALLTFLACKSLELDIKTPLVVCMEESFKP